MTMFAPGDLVFARGREWVALPSPDEETLHLRPLSGTEADRRSFARRLSGSRSGRRGSRCRTRNRPRRRTVRASCPTPCGCR
jgi:hypothetical protein